MKRSALSRSRPLARRTPLRVNPTLRAVEAVPDAEKVWTTPRWGRCELCGLIDVLPLHGHHVLARQAVARAGGDEWDARNRMDLCAGCHMNHEFGMENRKIPLAKVPAAAREFADELLGEDVARDFFKRRYA